MNETLDKKSGKKNPKRRLQISKKFKEDLELYPQESHKEELHELEKKVGLIQKITFIKVLPIVLLGQIYQTLIEDNEQKQQIALQEVINQIERENTFSDQEKKEIITALSNYNLFSLSDELLGKLGIQREGYKRVSKIDLTDFDKPKDQAVISEETTKAILKVDNLQKEEKYLKESYATATSKKENSSVPKEQTAENKEDSIIDLDSFNEKLDKLKNHTIVSEYELRLKDVRQELRELIFEYNVIASEVDKVYDVKEAEELLDRLTAIIKKIEELKVALNIPDIAKYDNYYLMMLVEDYMESFDNQNSVSEIKDSSLYMMLSSKLNELDTKKDNLQKKIEKKKESLELDETKLENLKEKYYNFDQVNRAILEFQVTQDKALDDINKKMAQATTIKERVNVQVKGMTRQSRRLMQLLTASMFLPGARSAKSMATMTALSLYFMKNAIHHRTITKRYKVVKTTDYSKEIEKSLSELDDISGLLKKTSRQLDLTIKDIEHEFAEYLNEIPECKELLSNLEQVREQLKEKEYEIKRIKDAQEKNLEKNNAKVKKLNYEEAV